jgi:hypothetical protein
MDLGRHLQTMIQKVLDLALNLLSLLEVGSLGSSICQTHSRNQVNLMQSLEWVEVLELPQREIHHYIPAKG